MYLTIVWIIFTNTFTLQGLHKSDVSSQECKRRHEIRESLLPRLTAVAHTGKDPRNWCSQQEITILNQLIRPCDESSWAQRKKEIETAVQRGIHPDDILVAMTNFHNQDGYMKPIHRAIHTNDLHFAHTLLTCGANPNQHSHNHPMALLFDVSTPEMAQLLLTFKADAQCRGINGETLLHDAQWRPALSRDLVLLFYTAGAKATEIASHTHHSALLDYITEHVNGEKPIDNKVVCALVGLGSPVPAQSNCEPFKGKNYKAILQEQLSSNPAHDNPLHATIHAIAQAQKGIEQYVASTRHQSIIELLKTFSFYLGPAQIVVSYLSDEFELSDVMKEQLENNAEKYAREIDTLKKPAA